MSEPLSSPFDQAMRDAQELYGARRFHAAGMGYDIATDLAIGSEPPDFLDAARAARGAFSAYDRDSNNLADDRITTARGYLTQAEEDVEAGRSPESWHEVRRERIQMDLTVGTSELKTCIDREKRDREIPEELSTQTCTTFRDVWRMLPDVEVEGVPDQYRINAVSRVAVAEALYGEKSAARGHARDSLRLARLSESPRLPTSAGLSRRYRGGAVARAYKRGVGAAATTLLSSPKQGVRRALARKTARFAL